MTPLSLRPVTERRRPSVLAVTTRLRPERACTIDLWIVEVEAIGGSTTVKRCRIA